jgi:hypothetical protein
MTLENEINTLMQTTGAYNSWKKNGAGFTFYDYIKMIVTEYHKIRINVYA